MCVCVCIQWIDDREDKGYVRYSKRLGKIRISNVKKDVTKVKKYKLKNRCRRIYWYLACSRMKKSVYPRKIEVGEYHQVPIVFYGASLHTIHHTLMMYVFYCYFRGVKFPYELKSGYIYNIYKKGDRYLCCYYKCIIANTFISRLYGRIIKRHIKN